MGRRNECFLAFPTDAHTLRKIHTHVLRTGIFSYNGKITLTVNMDVNIPGADAKALAKCWDAAFISLYNEICEYTVLLLNLFFPFLAAKVYA